MFNAWSRRSSGRPTSRTRAPRPVLAAIQPLEPRLLMARPGGGGGDPVPGGSIYYADYDMVETSFGTFPSFGGVYSMKGDGSAKTLVSTDYPRDPSRLLHGGRWMLATETVDGTYPNGAARREVFATRLGDGAKVQLTNNAFVEPSGVRWSPNDAAISFSGVSWTAASEGGSADYTYTDSANNQWLVDGGIFRGSLSWTNDTPAQTFATEVLDTGLNIYQHTAGQFTFESNVGDLDWSATETHLAYEQGGSSSMGSLHVTSFNADLQPLATIALGTGRDPEWSPDGTRLAYSAPDSSLQANSALWTVKPDGSNIVRVTKTAQQYDSNPGWSPDGKHFVFSRYTVPKGYKPGVSDVFRVAATGGSAVDLANNSEYAQAMAWRSDVQATPSGRTAGAPSQALRDQHRPFLQMHDVPGEYLTGAQPLEMFALGEDLEVVVPLSD